MADDAQDIAVQSVLISGRLHRQYAVFKVQGIVCVGFGGCVNEVHVFIHVHAAIVRGSAGQGAGEFYICRQLACIDGEFLHTVVRRVKERAMKRHVYSILALPTLFCLSSVVTRMILVIIAQVLVRQKISLFDISYLPDIHVLNQYPSIFQ